MKRLRVFGMSAVLAGVGVIALLAPVAGAAPPVKSEITFSDTGILEDVCAFPITVDATGTGTEIDFFDNSGALTRVQVNVTEETTFSANGTSLTTVPFTYDISVRFDDSGNISEVFTTGVIARVRLPGGGLFISAGRVDIAARGFPQFVLTPDAGGTVNLDRFCAALAA
jgi:hypothetical protein